jgi:hypothetical protein
MMKLPVRHESAISWSGSADFNSFQRLGLDTSNVLSIERQSGVRLSVRQFHAMWEMPPPRAWLPMMAVPPADEGQ